MTSSPPAPSVSARYSPSPVRTAVTVQVAVSLDQSARVTRWFSLMALSSPSSRTVSRMYSRIESPSAIAFGAVHGRNE